MPYVALRRPGRIGDAAIDGDVLDLEWCGQRRWTIVRRRLDLNGVFHDLDCEVGSMHASRLVEDLINAIELVLAIEPDLDLDCSTSRDRYGPTLRYRFERVAAWTGDPLDTPTWERGRPAKRKTSSA